MAGEMVDYVRAVVLNQSGVSMVAQANNKAQSVLQLLR
jgi:flagellin-like hook-associated protein FlgL